MVETITPVVHGGSRSRWVPSLVLHVVGAALSASALGAVLGATGALLGAPWGMAGVMLVTAVAALYLARELGLAVPVPQLRRQVPEWWRSFFRPAIASFLYGVGVGPGFFTYLMHGTFVVVAVAAVAGGRPLWGAVLVGAFGFARGLVPAVAAGARTPSAGAALVERLARSASRISWRVANAVVLALVVVVAWSRLDAFDGFGEVGAVAAAGITVVLGAAGVAKIANARAWRRSLETYRLPLRAERVVAIGVPFVEIAVATLPLLRLVSTAGLITIAMMLAFSAAIVMARMRVGRRLDCGCFGRSSVRDYRTLLVRNLAVATLGVVAWQRGEDVQVLRSLEPPTAGDLVPLTLAVLGVALAAWVVTAIFRETARGGPPRGGPR